MTPRHIAEELAGLIEGGQHTSADRLIDVLISCGPDPETLDALRCARHRLRAMRAPPTGTDDTEARLPALT